MNKLLNILCILFFICSFLACIPPWDLEKREIISFQNDIGNTESIGFSKKNGFIQKTDSDYIVVGSSAENQILLTLVSETGFLIDELTKYGVGEGHDIIQISENEYLILASTITNTYLFKIDGLGNVLRKDSLLHQMNAQIGLLESVIGLDIAQSNDGHFLITGNIKQTIGKERLFVGKVNENFQVEWGRSYNLELTGYDVIQAKDGNIIVFGSMNDEAYLTVLNEEGIFDWQRGIRNARATPSNQVILQDTMIYTITTLNNLINLKGFNSDISGRPSLDSTFGNGRFENQGLSIAQNRNSNLLLLGEIGNANIASQVLLSEIDTEGNELWTNTYDSELPLMPFSVKQVQDFGFVIFGLSGEKGNYHYHLIKTDEEGETR